MMDLISSFMNKNLEDFVKSYASTILPKHEETEDLSENENKPEATPRNKEIVIEHKEYSQTESPLLLTPKSKSFINKSVVESIMSDTTQLLVDDNNITNDGEHSNDDDRNNKMYGEYGKSNFDLSIDVLPVLNMEIEQKHDTDPQNDDYSMLLSEAESQWTQLPNVVHSSINLDIATSSTTIKSVANDSFLQNIAKEIELLDEELSSMGVLSGNTPKPNIEEENNQESNQDTSYSSDVEHDEEEKMDILKHKETPFVPSTPKKNEHQEKDQEDEEDEENIVIIKDKLSLLRKSLVFKKKTVTIPPNEQKDEDQDADQDCNPMPISIKSTPKKPQSDTKRTKDPEKELYFDAGGNFHGEKQKNAYFDPLVSPMKKKGDCSDYKGAIYHEAASKIQKQWKRFQLKTLLVHTFNRHLMQSVSNKHPVTITDLIASTTHEIVDHAEKLFAAVHQTNNDTQHSTNPSIDNIRYNQLHFYGSPALDWCAVYSMMESIVLRNLLYYKNSHIVKKIFDTQRILDDILSSNTPNTNADNILIEQLSTQLIQLKTKLYEECWDNNVLYSIKPLQLFPKDINIFRANHPASKPPSPLKQIQNTTPNIKRMRHTPPSIKESPPQNNHYIAKTTAAKPEFNEIRNQLSLLRKSFSKRKTNKKKARVSLRSSPKYSTSLHSSVNHINHPMSSLCEEQQHELENDIDLNTSRRKFNFESDADIETIPTFHTMERPQTAPVVPVDDPLNQPPPTYNRLPIKKPFLKRKKQRTKAVPKKVDWSHVKPKTVSRLSGNVRASRSVNQNRGRHKPPVVNWKQKAASRVDCNWSSNAYKSSTQKRRKPKRVRKKANVFEGSYRNCIPNKGKDDEYLYYLKKGNKIGKISRNSAAAQLQDGDGPMILKTNQNPNENNKDNSNPHVSHSSDDMNSDYDPYISDDIGGSDSDNQLKELQETFAAIEKAMKQRREQQHS